MNDPNMLAAHGFPAAERIKGESDDGAQTEDAAASSAPTEIEHVATTIPSGGAPQTRAGPAPRDNADERTALAIVAPGGAPNAAGGGNDCLPSTASAALAWNIADNGDAWRPDVQSLTLAGTVRVTAWPSNPNAMTVPNTANPDGGNLNNTAGSPNHWRAAIDDMSNYDTAGGGAGPHWHATAASRAHEWAHWNHDYIADSVTSAAGGNWPQVNREIDALSIAKDSAPDEAAARRALTPRVNAAVQAWRGATIRRWNTLISTTDSPGAGGQGYAAGAQVLAGLIRDVRAYADTKGWTRAAGNGADEAGDKADGAGDKADGAAANGAEGPNAGDAH